MDYDGIMHCFICDPENNEQDKLLLENLKLYEKQFKELIQNIEFDETTSVDSTSEFTTTNCKFL